jgi:hypothetical protein
MRKQIFSHLAIAGCLILSAPLLMPRSITPPAGAQAEQEQEAQENNQIASYRRRSEEPKITTSPVLRLHDESVVPGTGTILVRNRDHVFATIHTAELPPGEVVTAWWVIFNYPRHCATRPCGGDDFDKPAVQGSLANAGGKIIGADGTATYGAYRKAGDRTGVSTEVGSNVGLLNPRGAEIHLFTRTHGPALNDPMILRQQLSMFIGGCPPNTCDNLQASIHQP